MSSDEGVGSAVPSGAGMGTVGSVPEVTDESSGTGRAGNPRVGAGLLADEIARLPAGTILDERRLAEMFGCHPVTIKRAVRRGELPAPVRMFGRPCWTAGAILRHIEARLAAAQREAEREAERLSRLSP